MLRESFGADLPAAVSIFACLQTRPPPEAPSTPRRARPLAVAHISSASENTRGNTTTFKEHLRKQTFFYSCDIFPNSTPLSLPI